MANQPSAKRKIVVKVSRSQWHTLQFGKRSARERSISQYLLRRALEDAKIRRSLQTT